MIKLLYKRMKTALNPVIKGMFTRLEIFLTGVESGGEVHVN